MDKDQSSTIAIVANRGPHDFVWQDGHWVAKSAAGGLVSMIQPLARQPNVAWFCCVSEPLESTGERDGLYVTAKDQTDPDLNVVPVPVPAEVYRNYYGEISNEVLWMLQHHLVGHFGFRYLDKERHDAWEHYLDANRRLADAIAATEIPIGAFLLQDYHLYPLPALLRERFPNTPCLHFVHIPFPDATMLKLLPRHWRETILRGLLGADVVGLQTPADVRSFLGCCEELLGATVDYYRKAVITKDRTVRVRAFPASINPEEVKALQATEVVAEARVRLESEMRDFNVIRVDRLDPSKNQVLGFKAFERFLEMRPELRAHSRFLAFLIPSRTDLTVYRDYHDAVYGEINRINERFRADCGGDPIVIFYTNDRAQAFAAMERCDVLMVNSHEDGMNLVVKEWATVSQKPGVLIVSETAGVAAEAGENAIAVSPLDVEGTAAGLAAASEMPQPERLRRVENLRKTFLSWTAGDWLEGQLKELGLQMPGKVRRSPITAAAVEGDLVERSLTIRNRDGLHARPAAAFVRCSRGFDCQITIVRDGQEFSAQSIFGVLSANLSKGANFTLRAAGPEAPRAIGSLISLLEEFVAQEGT